MTQKEYKNGGALNLPRRHRPDTPETPEIPDSKVVRLIVILTETGWSRNLYLTLSYINYFTYKYNKGGASQLCRAATFPTAPILPRLSRLPIQKLSDL